MAGHHSGGTEALLKAIAAGCLDLVPTFAPPQLVSLASSFATLRFHDEGVFNAIARQALPAVHDLTPQQRADLLLAYALLVRQLCPFCTSFPHLPPVQMLQLLAQVLKDSYHPMGHSFVTYAMLPVPCPWLRWRGMSSNYACQLG